MMETRRNYRTLFILLDDLLDDVLLWSFLIGGILYVAHSCVECL